MGEDVQRVRDCLERPGQDLPPLALNAKMRLGFVAVSGCRESIGDRFNTLYYIRSLVKSRNKVGICPFFQQFCPFGAQSNVGLKMVLNGTEDG